jgi:hypothetical protein
VQGARSRARLAVLGTLLILASACSGITVFHNSPQTPAQVRDTFIAISRGNDRHGDERPSLFDRRTGRFIRFVNVPDVGWNEADWSAGDWRSLFVIDDKGHCKGEIDRLDRVSGEMTTTYADPDHNLVGLVASSRNGLAFETEDCLPEVAAGLAQREPPEHLRIVELGNRQVQVPAALDSALAVSWSPTANELLLDVSYRGYEVATITGQSLTATAWHPAALPGCRFDRSAGFDWLGLVAAETCHGNHHRTTLVQQRGTGRHIVWQQSVPFSLAYGDLQTDAAGRQIVLTEQHAVNANRTEIGQITRHGLQLRDLQITPLWFSDPVF